MEDAFITPYGTDVTGAVGLRPDRVARVVARSSA